MNFLFTGQGSQSPGMGKAMYDNFVLAREVYSCASDMLHMDIPKISFYGSDNEVNALSQLLIYTYEIAKVRTLEQTPQAVGGHSLGEYAALYYAGAFSLENGFRIINERMKCMEKIKGGVMFAIIGLDEAKIKQACNKCVVPVNFNSPSQTVIAGEEISTCLVAAALEGMGAKVIKLNVSAAFHTKFMSPAASEFKSTISDIPFNAPEIPIYSNLTGERFTQNPDFPNYLAEHMVSPVLFTREIENMIADGANEFLEIGPNKTLTSLLKRGYKGVKAEYAK